MPQTASAKPRLAPQTASAKPRLAPIRDGLSWAFRRIMGIYFRRIESAGNVPPADTGGRLFVANHVNALVDPILVLTSAPCRISPVAKSTLWKIPGLRWLLNAVDAVPITRRRDDPTKLAGANDEVFDKIAAWLAGGENILIFPEGTSHNEPRLIDVKSGAARMLARARARGGRGLSLQAVALEFDDRSVFRSRCLLLYGPVRSVDDVDAEGEALVTALTTMLRDDLSELLVEGATWPERVLIARVAEMLANDTGDRSLARWNSIGRQVEAASKALHADEATVAAVREAVDRYYDLLSSEGITDARLAGMEGEAAMQASRGGQALRGALLLMILPIAIVGIALYAAPYQLPRIAAKRVASELDEVSTYKLGAGLIVYPAWVLALAALAFVFLSRQIAWLSLAVLLVSPFAALVWLDLTPRLREALRVVTGRARLGELKEARAEAMRRIRETREKLGM